MLQIRNGSECMPTYMDSIVYEQYVLLWPWPYCVLFLCFSVFVFWGECVCLSGGDLLVERH